MDWYPFFYWKAQKRNKSYSKLTRFRRASFWASQFRSAISWPGSNQILIFGGPNLKKGIRVPSSQAKSYNIRYSAVFGHVPIVLTKNEVNNWLKQMVYKISKKTALAWIPMMGNILDISGDIIYTHTHCATYIYNYRYIKHDGNHSTWRLSEWPLGEEELAVPKIHKIHGSPYVAVFGQEERVLVGLSNQTMQDRPSLPVALVPQPPLFPALIIFHWKWKL